MSARLFPLRLATQPFVRAFASAAAVKPDIKLLAKLRQATEAPMSKAKEALVQANNDYEKALAWLEKDAQVSGAKKAQKVAGRVAGEGLISIASVATEGSAVSRSTIIELSCETDFVSRNDVFKNLASRIAATSLLLHDTTGKQPIEEIPIETLLQAPLLPHPDQSSSSSVNHNDKTVQEVIVETIGKLGENITLRRAAVAVVEKGASAGYVHGGDSTSGKIGGLATIQAAGGIHNEAASAALAKAARQVARQAVGYAPTYLNPEDVPSEELQSQSDAKQYLSEKVLTQQPFILTPDQTVAEYLDKTAKEAGLSDGANITGFIRWEVGEGIEKQENDFASEVRKAAGAN